MKFDVGALVKARGREWVVLPESYQDPDVLVLRPLGGTEDEVTGIFTKLETVAPADFKLPNPATDMGNQLSCGLLRDAIRLGFRSGAGPFRSLARIAVEPRPYQLVPLLMALKLDPVRMLIADDVGIGKTVEALLIARELLDRAEISRLTVLCPPHLAEQWQKALVEQFHIEAELVLSSTASRLERSCRQDESLFERYPFTVVSTDYIKGERRRYEFLRTCPDLVIVDEAHTCASAGGRSAQQRHDLLKDLIDPKKEKSAGRHLVLVTATPHSGNEETFRSLLSLLDPGFMALPLDLSGDENRKHRERLARHLVQRRRGDLKAYLDTVTPFPDRETAEAYYSLKKPYKQFLDKVLRFCRESVLDATLEKRRQRVRWWSALALLRALSSSPAAAAATLRNRSGWAEGETVEKVDEEGRRAVLDGEEGIDVIPGTDTGDDDPQGRERLLRLAREAAELKGKKDAKLTRALELVKSLINDGFSPILFCRFIPTVDYVAEFLRKKLARMNVVVEAITGNLPPEERERRIEELSKHDKRVVVCTDCLSEGINLQHVFDAVMHYDLSWNPTRHEQREGRVDRYGQPRDEVRSLTFFGQDNPVDGVVLQALLRKHSAIRKTLGITVPVPMDTRVIEEAIYEGLIMQNKEQRNYRQLKFDFDGQWDAAAEREKRSRTVFAQNQLLAAVNKEVRHELEETRRALGGQADVRQFCRLALESLGAVVSSKENLQVELRECPRALRDAIGRDESFEAVFDGRPAGHALLLTRTHPVVEGLSAYVTETALDQDLEGPGRRCGVVRTRAVQRRTTLMLLRMRFHIVNQGRDRVERPLLAEDLALVGFHGSPKNAEWLQEADLDALVRAEADANIGADQAREHVQRVLEGFELLRPKLDAIAETKGQALFDAHRRVRKATRSGIRALNVDVHKPADILGVYIYLPSGPGGQA